MLRIIPFIGLVMVVYAAVALLGPLLGESDFNFYSWLSKTVWNLNLPSSGRWQLSVGGLFLCVGLIMLGIESLKAAGTSRVSMGNHALSMLTFVAGLILFLMVSSFGTTVFFLLTVMAFIDTLAGMLVSIVTAKRDFGIDH
jgi:hypothetical protein